MPRDTRNPAPLPEDYYIVTGMLRHRRLGSLIEVDEGGFWLIDIGLWTLWRHRNRRITVEGMRCGFNELCVRRLKRA